MIRYYLGRLLCWLGYHDAHEATEIESPLYRYYLCVRCPAWFRVFRRDD